MQKSLNTTSLVTGLIPPLGILSAVTYYLIIASQTHLSTLGTVVVVFGYIWSTLWLYGALKNTYHLFYDDEFIYLKGYWRFRKISFTDIVRIQLTSDKVTTLGVSTWKYKIVFAPHTSLDDQYFWDIIGGTKADEFGKVVKMRNERVVVSHHT